MKQYLIIALSAFTVCFTSCSKERLRGSGATITETRSIASFDAISANGDCDVDIVASSTNKVVITGYENLVPAYNTNVNGHTLTLEFDSRYINVRHNNIRVTVYTTGFSRFHLNGSGHADIGSDINTTELEAEINGSGDISFGSGSYNTVRTHVNGSGSIDSKAAIARDAYAEISGSGDIDLSVTDYLSAKISGSGTIDYWGNPSEVNSTISGSGKVRKN